MVPEFVKIDDRVFLSQSSDHPWQRPDPSWPQATVVGFRETHFGHFRRTGINGLKPGVYRDRETPLIRLDDGTVRACIAQRLVLADPMEYRLRLCGRREDRAPACVHRDDFLRDLPDTPFWEGDIVRPANPVKREHEAFEARVMAIDYGSLVASSDEAGQPPAYVLGNTEDGGLFDGTFPAEKLALVCRGEAWRRAHGEKITHPDVMAETFSALQFGGFDRVSIRGCSEFSDADAELNVARGYADGVISGEAARALALAGDHMARTTHALGLPKNAEMRDKVGRYYGVGLFRLHDRDLARRYVRATFEASLKG